MDIDIKSSFNNLPGSAQHAILAGVIVVLAVFVYVWYLQPKDEQLSALTARNNELQQEVDRGVAVETSYVQLQKELEEMKARLEKLEGILPKAKEASNFLRSIQKMAIDSGLSINLFRPQAIVSENGFYSNWPVAITVEGNYNGLGHFFEKISRTPRVINVPTLSIQNIADQTDARRTIIATGTAVTYVQGVEQPQTEETK